MLGRSEGDRFGRRKLEKEDGPRRKLRHFGRVIWSIASISAEVAKMEIISVAEIRFELTVVFKRNWALKLPPAPTAKRFGGYLGDWQ
jgi:hypothetical protein